MYFPDLSRYEYARGPGPGDPGIALRTYPEARNIGWLDDAYPIPSDGPEPDGAYLDTLFEHCRYPVHLTGGHHTCQFCAWPWVKPMIVRRNGRRVRLGNGEVLVVGTSGEAFLAPTMIYHYVTEHGYRPPAEFVAALRVSIPDACLSLGKPLTGWSPAELARHEQARDARTRWEENALTEEDMEAVADELTSAVREYSAIVRALRNEVAAVLNVPPSLFADTDYMRGFPFAGRRGETPSRWRYEMIFEFCSLRREDSPSLLLLLGQGVPDCVDPVNFLQFLRDSPRWTHIAERFTEPVNDADLALEVLSKRGVVRPASDPHWYFPLYAVVTD
jgi:hypothetical protein